MQGSLPAGWLAFTGRELNPLDRDEGFQITSSSLPGLFLAQRPKASREGNRGKGCGGLGALWRFEREGLWDLRGLTRFLAMICGFGATEFAGLVADDGSAR
jgi:hypothetical protein